MLLWASLFSSCPFSTFNRLFRCHRSTFLQTSSLLLTFNPIPTCPQDEDQYRKHSAGPPGNTDVTQQRDRRQQVGRDTSIDSSHPKLGDDQSIILPVDFVTSIHSKKTLMACISAANCATYETSVALRSASNQMKNLDQSTMKGASRTTVITTQ